MFWNKKTEEEHSDIDSTMIELGREIERAFVAWEALIITHWETERNTYYEFVQSALNTIFSDKTLTNNDRLSEANKIINLTKDYKNKINRVASGYSDFIKTRLSQFYGMLEPMLKIDFHEKEKKWLELSVELSRIRGNETVAIFSHIDTDEEMANYTVKDKGAPDHKITEEEKKHFAETCAKYATLRKIAWEDMKKVEPLRSEMAEYMFGKLDDYLKGGSYDRLLTI